MPVPFHSFVARDNLYYQHDFISDPFEMGYIELRSKENRFYTDEVLKRLPHVDDGHPHRKEWSIRKSSAEKVIAHLRKKSPSTILDLGCGNGWLAHLLANALNTQVYAMDINETELRQGVRVFGHHQNITFLCGDIVTASITPHAFDSIVLAASIQYFPDFGSIVSKLITLLRPQGEIHIVDSPFYHDIELNAARHRSKQYFQKLGFPGMVNYYHHHHWKNLSDFNFEILYDPHEPLNRFKRLYSTLSPFPWIKIMA